MNKRQVKTCHRCQRLKRRCDQTRPACTRCQQAGSPCSLDTVPVTTPATTSSGPGTEIVLQSTRRSLTPSRENGLPPSASVPACETEPGGQRPARKRNRACLSCFRCHRMKVKCDRKIPCTRCRVSGFRDDCVFAHPPMTPPCPTELYAAREDPVALVTTLHSRHRGSSNWRALFLRIPSLCRLDSPPFVLAIKELGQADCSSGLALPGNYPFGSPGAAKYASTGAVIALLKSFEPSLPTYVDTYLGVFEPIHPILDAYSSDCELKRFEGLDDTPPVDELTSLAQYLMVLGLGRSANTGDHTAGLELFLAAESCLMRTPFMFRPSLGTLKTLCLMVFARRVVNATCWDIDSSWSLASHTVRLAVILGLHQDHMPVGDDIMEFAAWEARRKLWTTILYLTIEAAILTGMPSLLRRDEIAFDALDTPIHGVAATILDHQQLYNSFPTILDIVACVNSNTNRFTYEEIVKFDLQVREMMTRATALVDGLRWTSLDIFFRRVLLVLHRKFAHRPDAPSHFPVSYWSSLESSLGLLVHQRELCDGDNHALTLVETVFGLDFFSAALSTCIHLLQEEAPLAAPALMSERDSIPPRQTILETLKSCLEIWRRGQERSICFRSGYRFLAAALQLIPDS